MGHELMENRYGLLVDACLTEASGYAERVAALHMIEPFADRPQAITLGADRAYDATDFVKDLWSMKVRPHVAQNIDRGDRKLRRRSGLDCNLAPAAAGQDRQDRRRSAGPRVARLSAGRAAGVCDGPGADARGRGPPPPFA